MRGLRIVLVTLALAFSLSGCIYVGHPHPFYWGPCYRCW